MLIDGDNAQQSLIKHMLDETAKYGTVTIRRVYGDWTKPQLSGWKDILHHYAIRPMQQFNYTTGKNSTDGALIIDAMDILHSGDVDGFCIVSSDSDYTALVQRIREGGLLAVGIGRSTTPEPLKKACNVFIRTENLNPHDSADAVRSGDSDEQSSAGAVLPNAHPDWQEQVQKAIDVSAHPDDWALLADVGNSLRKMDPEFDSRTYGHKKLLSLIKSEPQTFETRNVPSYGKPTVYTVRLKPQSIS